MFAKIARKGQSDARKHVSDIWWSRCYFSQRRKPQRLQSTKRLKHIPIEHGASGPPDTWDEGSQRTRLSSVQKDRQVWQKM